MTGLVGQVKVRKVEQLEQRDGCSKSLRIPDERRCGLSKGWKCCDGWKAHLTELESSNIVRGLEELAEHGQH